MSEFLDNVYETLGIADPLDSVALPQDAQDVYGGANDLFSINNLIIGNIEAALAELAALSNSSVLSFTTNEFAALNRITGGLSTLDSIQQLWGNLETAQNADDLTGGLGSIASLSGNAGLAFNAAAGTLALFAAAVTVEVSVPLLIASSSIALAGSALTAIQSGVGEFNDVIAAIENAINQANSGGEPVVIEDSGGGGSSGGGGNPGGGGGNPGGGPGNEPIEPLVVHPGEDWGILEVTPEQQEDLRDSEFAPPPQDPPSDDSSSDGGEGGGGGGGGGGTSRYEDLEDFFQPPGGGGSGGGGSGGGGPGGYGPGGPSGGDKTRSDPLVLDLDGDGVELSAVGAPPIFFDGDGDGVATLTGWANPDDGFLARDIDGNGLIETQAELFGTNTVDAISDLATNDSNGDGEIDADDAIWTDLRVWRDLNQDGVSTSNELQTIDQAGIVSISLDGRQAGYIDQGNLIYSTTTYETLVGQTLGASAVFFGIDSLYSQTAYPEDLATSPSLSDLPNVKGFGTLADLSVAMFNDAGLLALVEDLVESASDIDSATFRERFEALALQWAGVDDVDPGNLPTGENLQHRAFVDAVRGTPRPPASPGAEVAQLEDSYNSLLDSLAIRFATELPRIALAAATTPQEQAVALDSPFQPLLFISLSPSTGILNGGLERIIYEIGVRLPEDPSEALIKLDKIMPLLSAFRDEYFAEEGDRLDRTFANEDFDQFVRDALAKHVDNPFLERFAFDSLNTGTGKSGGSNNDVLNAELSQFFTQYSRSFSFDGGTGDDQIQITEGQNPFGDGVAIYLYRSGDGDDIVDATGRIALHKIYVPDIASDKISIIASPDGQDAIVEFSGGGSITFTGFFARGSKLEVHLADGSVLQPDSVRFVSTPDDETFVGGFAPDSYIYETGDGADTIFEDWNGTTDTNIDRIVLNDVTPSDLLVTIDGVDLLLTFVNGQVGDSVRIRNQFSTSFFGTTPQTRIESVVFSDGSALDSDALMALAFEQMATSGNDTITGTGFADVIALSDGDDLLNGGRGSDTYLSASDLTGTTTIEDNGLATDFNRLILEGINRADVTIGHSGDDVTLTLPTGSVILRNQRLANGTDAIDEIVFADGMLSAVDLTAQLFPTGGTDLPVIGTSVAETLTGGDSDDTIDSLAGDDLLDGRQGSDVYIFGTGYGNDLIDETSGERSNRSVDRVRFTDLDPNDLEFTRLPGNDLQVRILASSETLNIDRQFASDIEGIEFFEFSDGTVWTAARILQESVIRGTSEADTIEGTGGEDSLDGQEGDDLVQGGFSADTYLFNVGDGNDRIVDAQFFNSNDINTIRLRGVDPADLVVERIVQGGSAQDALLRYGPTDSILLENQLVSDEFRTIRPIQRVVFDDGTELDTDDLIALATVFGTEGNDTLSGSGRIDALGGDDEISGFTNTDDTYLWRSGAGNDRIIDNGRDGGANRVTLEGLNVADVSLARNGEDLVATIIASGETLTVVGQLGLAGSARTPGVLEFVFDDETLTRNDLANASIPLGTPGEDTIIGGLDDETIEGAGGVDLLDGRTGSDSYVWRKGDGNDLVQDSGGSSTALSEPDRIDLVDVDGLDDIAFSRQNGTSNILQMTILETGEILTLTGIERIRFSDGAAIDITDVLSSLPFEGTGGVDSLEGDNNDNTLQGGPDDDLLNGFAGADTYVWARGDGNDTIEEKRTIFVGGGEGDEGGMAVDVPIDSNNDRLRLDGVLAAEVQLTRPAGTDDLVVTIIDTGESITIIGQFAAPLRGIEAIELTDGVIGRIDIYGTIGGETVVGDGSDGTLSGSFGPDLFELTAGNETVETGSGRDTIIIAPGGGIDRIEGFERGQGGTRIDFTGAPFADFDTLLAAASETPEGIAIDLGGGNQLILVGLVLSDLEPEQFGFARPAIEGTDAGEDLFGSILDDEILAGDGNDLVDGLAGDDTIEAGEGDDVVFYSGASTDFLITRNGTETIVEDINPADGDEGRDIIRDAELLSFLGDGKTISLVNRAPVAATEGNQAVGDEDTLISGQIPAATDPDGDAPLAYALSGAPVPGLTLNADGSFTYQPAADFNGPMEFSYIVSDPLDAESTPRVFVVDVSPVNDAPELANALADRISDEDSPVSFTLPVDAFSDVDGDALTLAATLEDGSPLPAWLGFDAAARSFSGTPPLNFNGPLNVKITASDGVLQAEDVFQLNVVAVNDAPIVAVPLQRRTVNEDQAINFALPAGVFSDVDGDALTLTAALADGSALPSWLAFDGANFTGTPPANFNGDLEIEVSASDGALSASSTFILEIVPMNDEPEAIDDDAGATDAGVAKLITAASLLANDSDIDGDSLSITSVSNAVGGSVQLDSNGDVLFTPGAGFTGDASFAYTLSDGSLTSMANVSLTVDAVDETDPYEGFVIGTKDKDFLRGSLFEENRIFGDDGNDKIIGGLRSDELAGGEGRDRIYGLSGNDTLEGNEGKDSLFGGWGDDILAGGTEDDGLHGGWGRDTFVFNEGDGHDQVLDFDTGGYRFWSNQSADKVRLDVEGIETFDDLLAHAHQSWRGVSFEFGDGDKLTLNHTWLSQLNEDHFDFGAPDAPSSSASMETRSGSIVSSGDDDFGLF